MIFLLLLLTLAFAFLLVKLISVSRARYGTLENSGFPVIPPTLFLGSVPEFYKKVQHDEDVRRAKKYGPIWGLYEGREPQVFICDPELVKQISIKDFDHFHSRRQINIGAVANEILDLLQGETWKFMRARLSPIFTTSKLKSYGGTLDEYFKKVNTELITDLTNDRLKFDCGKNISSLFINAFARATLGTEVADSRNPNNPFVTAFREMMGENINYNFTHSLALSFPFLEHFMSPFLDFKPQALIDKMLRQMLEERRGIPRNNDLADVLNEMWDRTNSEELTNLKITEQTLVGQALAFFVGGYDSSHLTVSYLIYFLAKYPDIQEQLLLEISNTFPDGPKTPVTYDLVQDFNMPYLDACIKEALRMGPSFFRPERICNRDWNFKGYQIKAGTTVMVATWGLHFNPTYFPNPDLFRPERFLNSQNEDEEPMNTYAFTPFGHGPRACVGMRFANLTMKIFMVNLLLSFQLEVRKDTKLSFKPGSTILAHLNDPLYVDLIPRLI